MPDKHSGEMRVKDGRLFQVISWPQMSKLRKEVEKKSQHSNYYVNILVHTEGERNDFCYEQHYSNTI